MKRRTKQPQPALSTDERWAEFRAPLLDQGEEHRGDLVLRYDADDPLVVDVSVRSCGDEVAVARAVLRSDLTAGTVTAVRGRDLLVGPTSGDRVRIVFYEGRAMIECCVPIVLVRRFLGATERVVPIDRETEYVDRLIASELRTRVFPDSGARG